MSCGKTFLTEEVQAVIGATGDRVEATFWPIEREGLRRFSQGLMDPDPRYWDEEFAKTTRFGGLVTPAIYCTYLNMKTPPGVDDPVSRAFRENPMSDGIGGLERDDDPAALPRIPTELKRVLNAGNEVEVYQYPRLGDRVFSQTKIAGIQEREGRDGSHMLIVTTQTTYTNQKAEVLCILRSAGMRR